MTTVHKRSFKSVPVNLGAIITDLIGGAHLPLVWFNPNPNKWVPPVNWSPENAFGDLSLVLDYSDTPHNERKHAYVLDVQLRIEELWPQLELEVLYDDALAGPYAKLVNKDAWSTVGTALVQETLRNNVGHSWVSDKDGNPQRSCYRDDVSKMAISLSQKQYLYLVDANGNKLPASAMLGDNHPEDYAWVVAALGHAPIMAGVKYMDLIIALQQSGQTCVHDMNAVVEAVPSY